MSWHEAMAEALLANGIRAMAYVPDEMTGELLERLENTPEVDVYSVTREEEGVGVLSGAYLGGRRGALIIQASGVGNSVNALASLNVACKIPVLLLVGERGGLKEFNPCQVPLGRAVPQVLGAIGIQSFPIYHEDEISELVEGACQLAFSTQFPVALILTTRLTGGKPV